MLLNECINLLLSKVRKSVTQHFASKLSTLDVTPVQYGVWKCLWENGSMTPSQIAQMLSVDTSTITGLLDRMENKEILKRTPNTEDRRAIHVSLTEQGKMLEPEMDRITSEANAEVLSVLNPEEQKLFVSYLNRILESLNGSKTDI
jgi:DNA-binding MarR family transcriptional regulator